MIETKKIGARIKTRREQSGFTILVMLDRLEKKGLKISRATYSRYENGNASNIPINFIEVAGEVLKVDPSYFLGLKDKPTLISSIMKEESKSRKSLWINVYDSIEAGNPIETIKDIQGQVAIPEEWTFRGNEYFTVKVKGDSMFPTYEKGDISIIKIQEHFNNNDECLVCVNDDNTILRKIIKKKTEKIMLVPINPYFISKEYMEKEVKVIGKVVEIRKSKES